MRFSIWPTAAQPWSSLLAAAQHAADTGWDGVYVADHFMPMGGDVGLPMHECWSTLAALASAVPRVRLGALVSGNTYRHPAVLVKAAVTADHVSGGRIVLGLGAGWQENEHTAYGIPFFDTKERLARMGEAAEIAKRMATEDRVDFEGRYYTLRDAPCEPKPVGPFPLLIGGGGERVTLRVAARWADEWNIWGTPELLGQKGEVLRRRCEEVGRDPGEIAHSAQAVLYLSDDEVWLADKRAQSIGRPALVGTVAQVQEALGAYRDAGVDEFIVPDFNLGSRRNEVYDQFIEEVAPALR